MAAGFFIKDAGDDAAVGGADDGGLVFLAMTADGSRTFERR
jgi:hypothetical protein